MKRKVRVYKAEDGQGQYHNQMSQFLKRAQMGMEQQAQQPDMQQIVMQVAGMLMPPPDGQGADAEQVYQSLIQSYGEAAATQIINVAVGMVQQSSGSEQAAGQEMAQEEEESVDDLTMQEELIREERERQQEQRDAEYMAEDDEFMYDLLYGDEEAQQEEQPEAKHGGAHHKKFVKKAMKLARKQMGDAGTGQGKNKADIFDGAMKRSEDFTNNLKNEATLSLLEKQFKNMSQAAPQMNAEQHFAYGGSQFGGMTGYGLDRFVYGGYDPSIPDLMEARYGLQHFDGEGESQTGNQMIAINDKDGNRRYVTQEEADNWNQAIASDPEMKLSDLSFKSESPMNDPNYKLWSDLKDKGVNVGDYRQGINYKQFANSGNKNTNYNYVEKPYSTDNIWDALIPSNRIFGKKYTMSGPMNHLGLPFTGPFNPMSMMNGFDVDKQRLGFGHKRYTFTPKGASSASGTGMGTGAGSGAGFVPGPGQAVDAMGKPVTSQKQLEMSYLNPAYLRQSGKELKDLNLHPYSKQEMRNARQDLRQYDRAGRKMDRKNEWAQDKFGNDGQKQKGDFWPRLAGFLRTAEKARDGLQTFQGNVNGSSVNNQETPIELKPKTAKEVWDKYEPELRKQWGSKIGQESELEKGTPSFRVDEENYFNGENFLNMANPMLKGLTNLFNRGEKKNFFGYQNNTSDDLADVNEQRFHGNYNPNSGLFREDLEGQIWQSKYGGVPYMKMGGPKGRTGQQVDYSLGIFPTAMGGSDINQYIGKKKPEISSTLKPVPRDKANLEAEKGETAYGDLNGDGFPEHYEIGGKRHYQGGTPLDLPDDTFIFSDTRSMRISDPKILKMFGKSPKKGGYTPAELAKQYDINAYRKILDDPDSDVVDRKTAEQMIKNFNIKLGALALAQESKKGFPQGIPVVAQPYMETMGISEEDILPKEEEAQQMAQQMMGQQGMPQGEQQAMMPEEQMAMASQEGMMASPEEMGMSPEGMMRYGGMRRLRRAQEGFITYDPYNRPQEEIDAANQAFYERTKDIDASKYFKRISNPDLRDYSTDMSHAAKHGYMDEPWFNMGLNDSQLLNFYEGRDGRMELPVTSNSDSPPWVKGLRREGGLAKAQEGGVDQMQQVMQQVEQALQQGAQPEEVAAQLMQNQMPPEAIMQIFMQIGIPQEEAAGIIQSVMQGAQEQMPMAAYGMEMGGYDMPFAQDGYGVPGGFNSPISPEDWADMQFKSMMTDGAQYFYADDNVVPFQGANANLPSYFPPHLLNKYGEPKMGARVTNMPMTRGEGVTSGESQMGYNIGDPFYGSSRTFKDTLYDFTHPGEFRKRKQYGIYNDVDDYNTGVNEFAYGGSLDRYQTKGEVKQKVYTEDNLPEGAVIVEKYTRGKKPGDFELQEDGTYRKVTKYDLKPSASSATKQQTAADFAAQSEENKRLLEQANVIIAREIGKGTIEGDADGGDIKLLGNLNLPFNERIILSKALNSNKDFGTDKFKVTKQSATTGYSQKSSRGDYKGTGSFVAGFTPEDYEKRYVYEQLKGMGADDETAFAEIDKIYSDPKQKAGARREYLNFLGVTAPADDAELLDANFYKTRYKDVTTAMERLDESTFRTSKAGGNDLISGFDHFDAMGFEYNPEYEAEQQEQEEEETDEEGDVTEDVEVPVPKYAPWWLQDTIKTAGAFGDLMGVKKYYPWAPKYNPSIPDPTFLDPTRSIAAQSEQARILGDTMSKITPSSSIAASRLAGLQGELAKGAADTANQYDKANVEIANQFAPMQAEMSNKAQEYNLGQTKGLYDANTLMNQQYDNSKRAMKQNLLNQYTSAITNRWKTDAMNQLYPQYAVDPATGGRLDFKGGKKQKPTVGKTYGDYYKEAFSITGDSEASSKYALLAWKQSQGEDIGGGAEAVMSMYGKHGGTFTIGPGMLPPLIL